MPVLRFVNDGNREPSQLNRIIRYVSRDGKISDDLVFGKGISPSQAYKDMCFSKQMFHQEKGKQYQHIVVSEDEILKNPILSKKIGEEIARFFEEYQVFAVTHKDTDNLHTHLIVNTVNMITGRKMNLHRKDFWALRKYANKVFERYNLPPIGAEQMYETTIAFDNDVWDDIEDFDDLIHNQLADYENKLGFNRAIYFLDPGMERADVLRAIDRAESKCNELREENQCD